MAEDDNGPGEEGCALCHFFVAEVPGAFAWGDGRFAGCGVVGYDWGGEDAGVDCGHFVTQFDVEILQVLVVLREQKVEPVRNFVGADVWWLASESDHVGLHIRSLENSM